MTGYALAGTVYRLNSNRAVWIETYYTAASMRKESRLSALFAVRTLVQNSKQWGIVRKNDQPYFIIECLVSELQTSYALNLFNAHFEIHDNSFFSDGRR